MRFKITYLRTGLVTLWESSTATTVAEAARERYGVGLAELDECYLRIELAGEEETAMPVVMVDPAVMLVIPPAALS